LHRGAPPPLSGAGDSGPSDRLILRSRQSKRPPTYIPATGAALVVGDRRGRCPPRACRSMHRTQRRTQRIGPPIVGGPGTTSQRARRRDRHLRRPQLGERDIHDFLGRPGGLGALDGPSSSALSDSCSKSACAFPIISNAVRVVVSSVSSFAFRARSRSSSAVSTDRFGRSPGALRCFKWVTQRHAM